MSSSSSLPPTSTTSPTNYVLVAGNVCIFVLWLAAQYVYIPYPLHLISLVTAILYVGCHQSLPLAPHVHEMLRKHPHLLVHHNSSASSSAMEPRETMRKEDAYQFPIVGSFALFGLYLAFKYLDKDLVNRLIGLYFAMAGIIAMTITFTPFVQRIVVNLMNVPNQRFGRSEWLLHHSLPDWMAGPSPWDFGWSVDYATVVAAFIALPIVALYFTSQRIWFLNNILAISFCLQGVRNFSVGSFQIAAILLIGLFFYDIFWVFGTEVMVKVATNLDGPIKILLPRGSIEKNPETGKLNLSLLGLGDIVIPGFFLALMLRFDFHLFVTNQQNKPRQQQQALFNPLQSEHTKFPKPYFHSTLIGYIVGLGTTLFVMFQFNAAQPALLYLVPACLGTSFGCAVARGEVKELMEYSEEEEEEEQQAQEGEEPTNVEVEDAAVASDKKND